MGRLFPRVGPGKGCFFYLCALFLLAWHANSLDNVRRCIGEKEMYGEACVRVMRCPWVEHGCCVSQLFASGLCMWYKCTCEESHVVDAYLPHGSYDIMCNVSFAWRAGLCNIFGGEHMCITKNHESPGCAFCPSAFLSSSSAFCRLYALLYIMSRLSKYCVIVIACVIILYSENPPCVGSTHAIFAVVWPVTHIGCEDGVRRMHVVCCTTTIPPPHHWSRGVHF